MSRRRVHHEDHSIEGGEINLVPYLDIMVNLIMFMLMTYQVLVELHLINFNPPASGPTNSIGNQDPDKKTLMLTVVIYSEGFKILTGTPDAGTEMVPMAGADYDYAGLNQHLRNLKQTVKVDPHLIVVATPEIVYDTVVKTLDAARTNPDGSDLFPEVTLGMAVGSQ